MNKLKLLCLLLGLTFAAQASAKVHDAMGFSLGFTPKGFSSKSEHDFDIKRDFREDKKHKIFNEIFSGEHFGGGSDDGKERHGFNERDDGEHWSDFGEDGHDFNEHGHGGRGGDDDGVGEHCALAAPEAETYQLLLVGLGMIGFVVSRRKKFS